MKRVFSALLAVVFITGMLAVTGNAEFYGEDKIVLSIDPGHGTENPGACNSGVIERDVNQKIANILKQKLEENGNFIVHLTKNGGRDLPLCERAMMANNVNADALISIHCDGSNSAGDSGTTVFTSVLPEYELVNLSSLIASNISASVGMANNGVRQRKDSEGYYWNYEKQWDIKGVSTGTLSDYYGIPTWCAKFGIPGIIVEHGFISNYNDREILRVDSNLELIAQAEANAIIQYYTNHTHTYGSPTVDFPSNCMFQGKQSTRCTQCGHRKDVQMLPAAPDNHYWLETVTLPASCGVDGEVSRLCRITENLIEKKYYVETHKDTQIIPAPTQHEYVETERVDATHTVDGYIRFSCTNCQSSFKEIIKAEGHTWEFVSYKEPTCTEDGGNTYRCPVCENERTDAEPALGHKYGEAVITEPTCTEDGQLYKMCNVCSYEHYETLAALGHDSEILEQTAPTCTESGYSHSHCKRCDEEIEETIEPLGHSFEVVETVKPTCDELGGEIQACSVCGIQQKTDIVAVGHKWSVFGETKEAGLFTGGSETSVCSVCNQTREHTTPSIFKAYMPYFILGGAAALIALIAAIIFIVVRLRIRRRYDDDEFEPFIDDEPWVPLGVDGEGEPSEQLEIEAVAGEVVVPELELKFDDEPAEKVPDEVEFVFEQDIE